MSNHNNIDDFFKKKLGNTGGGEIPEDFLADINSRLDALADKKKKRGIWWWMVPGMLLGIGLTLGAMYLVGLNAPNQLSPVSSQQSRNSTPTLSTETTTNPPAGFTTQQQDTSYGVRATNTPLNVNQKPVNNSGPNFANKNKSVALNQNAVNPKAGRVKKNLTNNKVEGGNRYGNERDTNQKNGSRNDKNIPILGNDGIADDTNRANPGNVSTTVDDVDAGESLRLFTSDTDTAEHALANGNITPADTLPTENPIKDLVNPTPAKSPAKWSIAFMAGSQFVKNTFPGNNKTFYYAKRMEEEKPIITLDASVLAGLQIKNWEFNTGFNYAVWGEKRMYSPVNLKITDYSIDTAGGDTSITTIVSTEEVKYPSEVNKYRYFSIPLTAGYTFGKNRFTVTPKLGLTAGIIFGRKTGQYISPSLSWMATEKASTFLLNAQAACDFSYRLKNLRFIVSPFYRRNINALIKPPTYSALKADYAFAMSGTTKNLYQSVGLNFGVSFDF